MTKKRGRQGASNNAAFRDVQAADSEGRQFEKTQDELSATSAKPDRAGGLKGGTARKAALSPKCRSQIAKAAAAKCGGKPNLNEG